MSARLTVFAALVAGVAIASMPVGAQDLPQNIRREIVYGTDPCPRGKPDEVVICARRPDRDRYRIPEALREPSDDPENQSWANRAEALEYVGRSGVQSCSTVGPGGFTGCWNQMIRQSREERRAAREEGPEPR